MWCHKNFYSSLCRPVKFKKSLSFSFLLQTFTTSGSTFDEMLFLKRLRPKLDKESSGRGWSHTTMMLHSQKQNVRGRKSLCFFFFSHCGFQHVKSQKFRDRRKSSGGEGLWEPCKLSLFDMWRRPQCRPLCTKCCV